MKYTIITGASAGIGKELASVAAEHGKNLVLAARRIQQLNELKEELVSKHSIEVKVVEADLSTRTGVESVIKAVANDEVEILINNAGFGYAGSFEDQDPTVITSMIDVNIKSLTTLTHGLLPKLIESKGRILNLASTAAFLPGPYMAEYFATKHYVLAFSQALNKELESKGVSVTTLCPGATRSEFQDRANLQDAFGDVSKLPSSREVAEYGWKILMKRKLVGVHGMVNKLMVLSGKFIPRSTSLNIIAQMMSSEKK